MLNNVPIARKLALLCAVFLIPVVLLAWLLFDRSNKAIVFAENEIDGTSYISSILDLSDQLTRAHWEAQANTEQLGGIAVAALKKADSGIAEAEQTFGVIMRSASQAADVHQAVNDFLAKGPVLLPNQHLGVLASINALISRVGDHSNLILDPDLDSYYVMDMAVLRLPALVATLEDATSQLWTMKAATPLQYQHFLDLLSAARSTLKATNSGITLAAENNPNGQVERQLRPSLNGMNEKVTAYMRSLELAARMVQGGLDFDRAEVVASHHVMQEALFQSWRDSLSQLGSLLNLRIHGLQFELWLSLGASAVGLVLAGLLAAAIARGINRPLRELQAQMARLASGETNIVISARDRQDEVGHMAEALEVFRENAVRTQRMKAALDCVSTPVVVASSDGVLTDINHAARQHFDTHGPDIRADIAAFDIHKALGESLEAVFQNEALKAILSASSNGLQRGQVSLGSRTFDVRANSVISERGERLGIVSEWIDISERLRMEAGIARLVEAGIAGDFSQRLNVEEQRGFLRALSERMNEFIDTVSESLTELVEVNADLAQGDLMRRIDRPYEGAFQALADNTNQMADRLADIVRKIAEAAHAVHNASAEIAQGSEDLATRTEQQAANLEETAAAMEELAVTVRQNAHSAQQADDLANQARAAAESGSHVVAPAITAMGRIEESSGKISEITTVIEEIAFQTNLLALNAAVEAARAGDAGRGFAVVAAEVRQLAQRTSRSSKEIKEIIQRSNSHVQDGVKMVAEVGKALSGIVEAISSVASIIGEIASASREQSSGLDEVNAAVAQMDEMTQQNAALVEETTAAAHSLSVQAEALVDLVSYFRVHDQAEMAWQNATYGQPYEETTAHEINSLSHHPMRTIRQPQPALLRTTKAPVMPGIPSFRGSRQAKAPVAAPSPQRRTARVAAPPLHPSFDQDADWSEF